MAPTYRTPGVYIVEKSSLPNSVVPVASSVPAFIGYTERAGQAGGEDLSAQAVRVGSLLEFEQFFGGPALATFCFLPEGDHRLPQSEPFVPPATVIKGPSGAPYHLAPSSTPYQFYRAIKWFFLNGGGNCHVISVGSYDAPITLADLQGGIQTLETRDAGDDITLLVIPEAVLLPPPDCHVLQAEMVRHCGEKKRNRMAILDIPGGFAENARNQCIDHFRQNLSGPLSYAAAYYPWLNTSLINRAEVSLSNLTPDSDEHLVSVLLEDVKARSYSPAHEEALFAKIHKLADRQSLPASEIQQLHQSLITGSPFYQRLLQSLLEHVNLLPPAAAMAGIYTRVDKSRGVWKAPANLNLAGVVRPAVSISRSAQADLNSPASGKAINAIREFSGRGTLVWGARTLGANHPDWRYINVRRTVLLFEESIRQALNAFVFEPNSASTWAAIEGMINQFLTNQWQMGGLAGSRPSEAFGVNVGLGKTMTADDIREGRLRLQALVALVRPAEFLVLTFELRMQNR